MAVSLPEDAFAENYTTTPDCESRGAKPTYRAESRHERAELRPAPFCRMRPVVTIVV